MSLGSFISFISLISLGSFISLGALRSSGWCGWWDKRWGRGEEGEKASSLGLSCLLEQEVVFQRFSRAFVKDEASAFLKGILNQTKAQPQKTHKI